MAWTCGTTLQHECVRRSRTAALGPTRTSELARCSRGGEHLVLLGRRLQGQNRVRVAHRTSLRHVGAHEQLRGVAIRSLMAVGTSMDPLRGVVSECYFNLNDYHERSDVINGSTSANFSGTGSQSGDISANWHEPLPHN